MGAERSNDIVIRIIESLALFIQLFLVFSHCVSLSCLFVVELSLTINVNQFNTCVDDLPAALQNNECSEYQHQKGHSNDNEFAYPSCVSFSSDDGVMSIGVVVSCLVVNIDVSAVGSDGVLHKYLPFSLKRFVNTL